MKGKEVAFALLLPYHLAKRPVTKSERCGGLFYLIEWSWIPYKETIIKKANMLQAKQIIWSSICVFPGAIPGNWESMPRKRKAICRRI